MHPLMMVERLYFETDSERRFYRSARLSLFVFDSIDNHLEQVVLLLRRQSVQKMKVSFDIFRKTYCILKLLAYNGNCWST